MGVVKQISVFIENTPGRLADFTGLLGESGIDLISLCIADTTSFGILRGIVRAPQEAAKVIARAGYTVRVSDVLAVEVPDSPGGLNAVLDCLARAGVGVEYLYSFMRNKGHQALIILRTDEETKACEALARQGVTMLSQEEIERL